MVITQRFTLSKSVTYVCLVLAAFVVLFAALCTDVLAKVGVGMGAGEIRVTEDIKPGGIYALPSLRVFNTGDEVTTYGMNIAYHQDNQQLRPEKSWFTFTPSTFTIEAGESQEVQIVMMVPVKTDPGEYFAFVESGPVSEGGPGTSVGVAVATKLYFTVVHANIWEAVLYRISAFFTTFSPWSWIGAGVLLVMMVVFGFIRFFSLNISVRRKDVQ